MDRLVKKWLEHAKYDLETARSMYKTRRYLYVAFMCQQAIEKVLKAKIAEKGKGILPIHNLVRLAEISGVNKFLDEPQLDFLADLTPLKHIVIKFVKSIKKDIKVNQVILFGSYLKGKTKPSSDIDLIVVSPDFNKKDEIKTMQYLFRKAARINSLIEPIPATPEDIKKTDPRDFLGQVIKSGKVIWSTR
ncbi:MAG: hypothetical protein COY53_07385 [Elusimicrobia bacterium CG_4_10_14_0_8_um_filter_37_32]|nr:MAG: hypothetical protein COS17_04355 [Elusimicrobia bacterium CG02_land_8_20_14_3_00_37_13]PIZ12959.1 MAG: hypothetical protein COY53_07385 [Elusimicrobia bacterium CG_4_10_14_0_8_um_filter_37_32]